MVDRNFFIHDGPLTLAQIIEKTGARAAGPFPGGVTLETSFDEVAPLDSARPGDVSVFHNGKYLDQFKASKAGICFVKEQYAHEAPPGMVVLLSADPYRDFAHIARAFYPGVDRRFEAGTSLIHSSATLGKDCIIEPGAVIQAGAQIGDGARIGSNAVIGKSVKIGRRSVIEPGVTISHALIGDDVVILANASIGQAGFGFSMGESGHVSVPQLGRVIIEDRVEIGAGTTIDRGSLRDTFIGAGSRIDNLVMLGHNVCLGKGCVIVAQVGISGSTELGDYVVVGGQVGITGHLKIGNRVQIAAGSAVIRNVPDDQVVAGRPALPYNQWRRQMGAFLQLGKKKKEKKNG